ncbi:FAD-dependent oxidoreductase [Desulfonatronum thioautotrophicum]|uniref:FAD-dependent oxidoreductase n=1 Tax=Desulfonatronum thioautotrophicum TaxID=617001 RepID=UPI0024465DFC|nr:FAD-dependent oxidoreductase [Desulfonatronum thioautotrophicum]
MLENHRVMAIDPVRKHVVATVVGPSAQGESIREAYDALIIATGAVSRVPTVNGLDRPNVFFLRWMEDAFRMKRFLDQQRPRSAVIIGGGYIGLEMADALTRRGLRVTLAGHAPTVLKTVDPEFGRQVAAELRRNGVNVATRVSVQDIADSRQGLRVSGTPDFQREADMVLVAVGAVPASELAASAGIRVDRHGAIQTNQRMETNLPDVFAAGDCVQTWHRLLQTPVYLPLGTTAHKQGRVAGENAVGGNRQFTGTLGTQVVKVFDMVVARTGLGVREAEQAGYAPRSTESTAWDHKQYYPGAHPLRIQVVGDKLSGRLLGAQIIGHHSTEVAKRIDVFATAIFNNMSVDQLNDLDLSYTPPLSSPWDPVQIAAQALLADAKPPSAHQGHHS